MKKIISLLFFILAYYHVSAQNDLLSISGNDGGDENFQMSRIIESLSKNLTNEFSLVNDAVTSLKIKMDHSKVYKLEGMSSKFSGTAKIYFTLSNTEIAKDTTWYFSSNVSGKNLEEINSKLADAFLDNKAELASCKQKILSAYFEIRNSNCKGIFDKANAYFNKGNLAAAYNLNKTIINSSCKANANGLKLKIEQQYGNEFCDEKLTKIRMLANSGIDYQMEKAIDELSKIPPKAKCKEEALKISKQIGDYLLKKPQSNIKNTTIIQLIQTGASYDQIFKEDED